MGLAVQEDARTHGRYSSLPLARSMFEVVVDQANCRARTQDDTSHELVLVASMRMVVRFFYGFDATVRLAAGSMLELHSGVVNAIAMQQVLANVAEDAVAFRGRDVVDSDVHGERSSL